MLTLIISSSKHLLVGGKYYAVSENVLKVDGLKAGKLGKRKDLSEFDKGQIVKARQLSTYLSIWF